MVASAVFTNTAFVLITLSFSYAAPPKPVALITGLPEKWQYKGCLQEAPRGSVFPYQIISGSNTPLACMSQCDQFGYSAAGLKAGNQCYCGDIADVTDNKGLFLPDSACSVACSGDALHTCGADKVLNTYYSRGGPTWRTPNNIGRFEYLASGPTVPLSATLGINDKIAFLDKYTGPKNTGAYELDLSLIKHAPDHAWRTMHLKTNVFCGAGIVLPDKAGRQISLAGWKGASGYAVRFYTPDGSPGVNGKNDWEEDIKYVKLQRPRWYNSAIILANGSVLTIGGQNEPAGPLAQPNLEVLPKPAGGETVVNLDWLSRTNPNNLYPFLTILPSTKIFVAYYNEARILDPVGFQTLTVLPNLPGAVNDPTAGRNYPLSGAHMPLPHAAPYKTPLEVLICGGSTLRRTALDNCVSIAPEARNPTWIIERMPSKRVMPCMVALPDGTILILNGAQQGLAGFALATDPNFDALLYDPSLPVGSRFSILASSTIARMYHSEATLLPDGRVLLSGSDPEHKWKNGTARYPQEYRIEVFTPPYLTSGKQPTFTLPVNDWAYGASYSITNIRLFQGTLSTLRISLISASSGTHGNSMGAKTLFPAFSCSKMGCTIVAPPNAGICPPGWYQLFILDGPTPSVSKWVRIGGDPSKLGNWPNFPPFTLPGV